MSLRIWTTEEIKALPEFGREHGWFFGLVAHKALDEYANPTEDSIVLAEIYPGMGYALLTKDEADKGIISLREVLEDLDIDERSPLPPWHYAQPGDDG